MEDFLQLNNTAFNKTESNEKSSTGSIILVLSFSVLISCICKIFFVKFLRQKINLSFYVLVLFLGFLIGIIATQIKGGFGQDDFLRGELHLSKISPHLIYYIFLPLIIFDSSFNACFNIVKQQVITAILVALPGVLISTGITALFVVYLFPYDYEWSWFMGLLFGSILSTTDPITIVTLLQECGASQSLSSLIGSESLINDGLVFTFLSIFNRIMSNISFSMTDIIFDIVRFSVGGTLFGLICGFMCVSVLNRINNELKIEITITFAMPYLIFYVADAEFGVSPVLSVIAMGLYMAKHKYCISSNVQLSLAGAWQIIVFVVNILIFTLSGLIIAHSFVGIQTNLTTRDIGIALVLYLLIHASRALFVGVLHPLITWSGIHLTRKECVVFAWSGLRGRTALILVLLIYLESKIDRAARERLIFHISLIVLLTLIINGISSKFLIKMLGLHKGTPESQSVLLQALKHMRSQTARQIKHMKEDINFVDVNWKILSDYLPEKLLEELDQERDTNIHERLSMPSVHTDHDISLEAISRNSNQPSNLGDSDQTSTNSIYQLDIDALSVSGCLLEPFIQPVNTSDSDFGYHQANMRHEIVKRILTAMSVDYEKQWYLGMIRRRTLKILIETVEEAKAKLSLKKHWQLLVKRFCMPLWLQFLAKFNKIGFLNRLTEKLLFEHLISTIELSLAFHSAKSRMENLLNKFPEFANIDNIIMHRVLTEAKMLQIRASLVLHDLQHSYRNCWTIEMTKRCAQMLLKYESVAIVQLYETGMLNENEYAHILKLIQKKIFHLEYGHFVGIPKIYVNEEQDNPFNNISLFADLTEDEKFHFKRLLAPRHKWFQPGEVLLRQGYITLEAYLIVRGIVESSEDLLTCYRSGHIIGIDALFDKSSSVSHRTYKAEGSIVEAFSIDEYMLKMLLSNPKLTRLVYNEIALHLLINMYRQPINLLNYAQIKALLDQHAIFYQSDIQVDVMTIPLKRTERLFLLKGTVQREDDDYFLEGPQLVTVNRSTSFHCSLDQLCIAYRWTVKDEQECLQIARSFTNSFRFSNPNDIERSPSMAYPFCSSYTTQITPQYHSLIQVARSAACTSNTGLIPMEIVNIDHGNI